MRMHDADAATFDKIAPLLEAVRARPELEEKSPGAFYAEARLFLRFVEDDDAVYADLRWAHGHEFDRFEVSSDMGRRQLLSVLDSRFKPH
jgi:hypothetical protein